MSDAVRGARVYVCAQSAPARLELAGSGYPLYQDTLIGHPRGERAWEIEQKEERRRGRRLRAPIASSP